MYQQEQKLQNMHQSSSFIYQHPKKLIQLAISFSILSFLFLHPSLPPFFHSFSSYLSTLSTQIFSLAADKNYIFLLCNGILVFIAKYSGHTADTPPRASILPDSSLDNDLMYNAYRQSMQSSVEDVEDENEEEDVQEKHVLYQNKYETVKEEEGDVIDNDEDNEYMKEESDCWSYEEQANENKVEDEEAEIHDRQEQEQEEEAAAIAKMSTEELNRKFDDFIRKMKEDLRFEARQQLIAV
ncbi:ATP-dependent RNA helicase MAK5 [Bienertia sinuspersici]